jgi:hypothetical protein
MESPERDQGQRLEQPVERHPGRQAGVFKQQQPSEEDPVQGHRRGRGGIQTGAEHLERPDGRQEQTEISPFTPSCCFFHATAPMIATTMTMPYMPLLLDSPPGSGAVPSRPDGGEYGAGMGGGGGGGTRLQVGWVPQVLEPYASSSHVYVDIPYGQGTHSLRSALG